MPPEKHRPAEIYFHILHDLFYRIREDKRGYIPGETPRILERLNIDPEPFIATAARMLDLFSTAIGTPEHLTAHGVARNVAFLRGMGAARALFERKAA